MDIQKFVQQRKKLGLSQNALSKGICTQATLSKFENRGQVPSLAILNQLCQRLGLTIDELNQDESTPDRYMRELLDEIEQDLMIENFPEAVHRLKIVAVDKLKSAENKMQYYYLEGMVSTLISQPSSSKILFNFSKVLDELDENHQTIYSQLAYLGSGVLYARKNSLARADLFFSKVIAYLRLHAADDYHRMPTQQYLRFIMMMYYAAEYHYLSARYQTCDQVLTMTEKLCQLNHVTYFLPRIKLLAANNEIAQEGDPKKIETFLNDAQVFARFNRNNAVLVQVAALRRNFTQMMN